MIEIKNLSKTYLPRSKNPITVLKDISATIKKGETVAVTGSSGSGKTTFLTLVSGLDYATSGSIAINGRNVSAMSENELTHFRAKHIGFVFQQFYLLPHFTALENVTLPLDILKTPNAEALAKDVIDRVGLSDRRGHLPDQLSGGECQRIAIARALVTKPDIIFADEPTGNLDTDTAENVTGLFFGMVKDYGVTMVIVTHNEELAENCSRRLRLSHGKLV